MKRLGAAWVLLLLAAPAAAQPSASKAKVEVFPVDAHGRRVDLDRSHASLSRLLPSPLLPANVDGDEDALRWVVVGQAGSLPRRVDLVATAPGGGFVDRLDQVRLRDTTCPDGVASDRRCAATPPIRATSDAVDRSHPAVSGRSIEARVGGRIEVYVNGAEAASIAVGGPRETAVGTMERYRARLRVRLVRMTAGGAVPIGGDKVGALEVGRREVHAASAVWGQCGVHFGDEGDLDLEVVDPPGPHLLAIGCDLGLPASGGELAFVVEGRSVRVPTRPGEPPTQVAHRVASKLRALGYDAEVSPNARVSPGALRGVDVLVRHQSGQPATLGRDGTVPLSSDASLSACLGELDLTDGLDHFTDLNAVAGSVEERTLIKAFDDADPRTLEVFIVPAFGGSPRIGESFIRADGSSVRNVVIIDRSGVRARARSYALAHEIGHILLDLPGHPDDYGVDRPDLLMDSDAADPSIFGPRRLLLEDCERALRQSGPNAPVPLLTPWPLRSK